MSADAQIYFNIAIVIFGGLGGWILNSLRDSLKSLHESDVALSNKVQGIEILVAGSYVTNSALEKLTTALFHKLDKIDDKLDHKIDKPTYQQQDHRRAQP